MDVHAIVVDQFQQETAAIPAEATVIPDVAVTVLKDNGWSGQYAKAMVEIARANDISPHLLEAVVWQESRWNPGAISRAGAIGLAQLMPGTARDLGVDPRDPLALGVVAALLLAVACAAAIVPARRATSVVPMLTLRNE